MAINRRQFLQAGAGGAVVGLLPFAYADSNNAEHLIGACRLDEDHYAVSAVSTQGKLQWQLPLPDRGHDVVLHDHQPVGVAMARRPGRYMVLFDRRAGLALQRVDVPDEYKLNGHAAWVNNRLVVSASDVATSRARLLVFELSEQQLTFQSEHALPYLGPHEICYRQNRLVLAIGGLKTAGREVLNRDSIHSGVIELDPNTLDLIGDYWPSTEAVSWRHLDIDASSQILLAGQHQQPDIASEPLLIAVRDGKLHPFQTHDRLWDQLQGYIGSIHACGDRVLVSSPRAHWLGVFDRHSLSLSNQVLQHDVCAIASIGNEAFAASGTGQLWRDQKPTVETRVIWDNHFTVG